MPLLQESEAAQRKREEQETTQAILDFQRQEEHRLRELHRQQAAMRESLSAQVQAARSAQAAAAAQVPNVLHLRACLVCKFARRAPPQLYCTSGCNINSISL